MTTDFSQKERSLRKTFQFLPKDFVETAKGEFFAVVAEGTENGRALCFLRYLSDQAGTAAERVFSKQPTSDALSYMESCRPDWIYYSPKRDTTLHGVPQESIERHWRPSKFLRSLTAFSSSHQAEATRDAQQVLGWLLSSEPHIELGVTGSLLIGAGTDASDLDLTTYGLESFQVAQRVLLALVKQGKLQQPRRHDFKVAYGRRGCSLTVEEYAWHERRKHNKFMLGKRMIDLSCVELPSEISSVAGTKSGSQRFVVQVVDASRSYCHPAEYRIDHSKISHVLSFTPTYAGQAKTGEWIEAAGNLETTAIGGRLVIGADREATGQYLRVVDNPTL